jgi:hypothetical protein
MEASLMACLSKGRDWGKVRLGAGAASWCWGGSSVAVSIGAESLLRVSRCGHEETRAFAGSGLSERGEQEGREEFGFAFLQFAEGPEIPDVTCLEHETVAGVFPEFGALGAACAGGKV